MSYDKVFRLDFNKEWSFEEFKNNIDDIKQYYINHSNIYHSEGKSKFGFGRDVMHEDVLGLYLIIDKLILKIAELERKIDLNTESIDFTQRNY